MTTRTLVLGDWNPWIRDPIDVVRVLLVLAAVAFLVAGDSSGAALLGGVWEIWEWVSDHTIGSSLQLGLDDTVGDLVADTAGSIAGALLLVCWARYGWGSVRRIPGENRYEDAESPGGDSVASSPGGEHRGAVGL